MLAPGTEVDGYRVEAFVAAGGMGAVYRATQLSLQRPVALKLLSEQLGRDRSFRERFRREARLQAHLQHPHIVPVYEAGESPHGLYIAMRFLDGANLDELVGTISRSAALELLAGVAAALDAAHAAGLVHRDVKPQNILVSDGQAYLADFGLTTATGLSSMTAAGQFLGTVDYVSPEQIRDEEPDARSDVYSLGAVLYRCLTGSVPFPRATKVAVIYAQLEQLPEPATTRAPELPAALDPVLRRALAKDPGERYASASELIDAARTALGDARGGSSPAALAASGSPTAAERAPSTTTAESTISLRTVPVRAASRPAPRVRPRLALGLIALALLAGVGGFLAHRAGSSPASLGATRQLSADGVSVAVPADWQARTPALPELFPAGFAAAGPRGEDGAVVAVGLTRGFGPSMLPSPLQAVTGVLTSVGPAVQTGTGLAGRLYSFVGTPAGGAARRYEILFVPTRHLVATAACVSPAGARAAALNAACARVLTTIRAANVLALDPRPAYAAFLSSTLGTLAGVEQRALTGMRGGDQAVQAQAASRASTAFTAAAAALRHLIGRGLSAPELGLQKGLINQLTAVAGAYSALAGAAHRGDGAAYAAAAAQVQSTHANLAARLYELRRGGYAPTP
jgi:predicted Ser/Thr protein kinase